MPPPVVDGPGDRFGLLLLVLVVTYLLSAFVSGLWVVVAQIILFATAMLLAVRTSHLSGKTARTAVTVSAGGSLIALVLAVAPSGDTGKAVSNLWIGLILLFAVILIMRRVLAAPEVTLQSIFGAVSAYMIIGLMFAACYAAIARFDGGAFFASQEPATAKTFQYFSFTTLTTLGYGDFTAAGSDGRAVAVMEALLGQIFLATLVARLVSAFRPAGRRPARAGYRPRPRPAPRRIRRARALRTSAAARIPRRPSGEPSP